MVRSSPGFDDIDSLPRAGVDALPETCPPRPAIVDAGSRALYVGPSFTLGPHRNTVAVLAVGLDDDFALHAERRSATSAITTSTRTVAARPDRRRMALIPPGQWHRLDANGTMGFLYLDAHDRAWRSVAALLDAGLDPTPLTGMLATFLRGEHRQDEAWLDLLRLLQLPEARPADGGQQAAMAAVLRDPAGAHPVSHHAAACGCSISTFQRRFTAHAGLPWRRWRLWQRLRHAAQAVCSGTHLTSAALDAGFASGAHFSDAFRDTFGLPPIRLVEWRVQWRKISASS